MSSDPGPDPVTPDDAEAGIDRCRPARPRVGRAHRGRGRRGSDDDDEAASAAEAAARSPLTASPTVATAVPTAAVAASKGTTGGGRGHARQVGTTPGTPDDQPYIDDPVSKVWVGVMIGVFGLILAYALLFGHGGLLTPKPTPEPTLATVCVPVRGTQRVCRTPAPIRWPPARRAPAQRLALPLHPAPSRCRRRLRRAAAVRAPSPAPSVAPERCTDCRCRPSRPSAVPTAVPTRCPDGRAHPGANGRSDGRACLRQRRPSRRRSSPTVAPTAAPTVPDAAPTLPPTPAADHRANAVAGPTRRCRHPCPAAAIRQPGGVPNAAAEPGTGAPLPRRAARRLSRPTPAGSTELSADELRA